MKIKHKYYLTMVNLRGLISKKPILCYKEADWQEGLFWDKTGDFDVDTKKSNFEIRNGCIKFWSKDEKEVKDFIKGVMAANTLLKDFAFCSFPVDKMKQES